MESASANASKFWVSPRQKFFEFKFNDFLVDFLASTEYVAHVASSMLNEAWVTSDCGKVREWNWAKYETTFGRKAKEFV